MPIDTQKHSRESQENVCFPQNHNLQESIKQFHMIDFGPIQQDSNFDFEFMVA